MKLVLLVAITALWRGSRIGLLYVKRAQSRRCSGNGSSIGSCRERGAREEWEGGVQGARERGRVSGEGGGRE